MRIARIILCLLLSMFFPAQAQAWFPLEFGIRGGLDAAGTRENYGVQEIYVSTDLPWRMPVDSLVGLSVRLEVGAAQFEVAGEDGHWLAAGGALVHRSFGERLEFEAGWRPTWLPDYKFGRDHFGGQVQFSTHAGVAFVWQQIRWSYRFQHTSNAGFYDDNPGLDLHMFGVGFRF